MLDGRRRDRSPARSTTRPAPPVAGAQHRGHRRRGRGPHAVVARRRHVLDRHAPARPAARPHRPSRRIRPTSIEATASSDGRARAPAPRARRRRSKARCSTRERHAARRHDGRRARARRRDRRGDDDDKGRWKLGPLRPGHWKLDGRSCPATCRTRATSTSPRRARRARRRVRDVRIELARGALVGGTVRDRRGQRVAGAHVTRAPRRRHGRAGRGRRRRARASSASATARPASSIVDARRCGDARRLDARDRSRPGDEVLGARDSKLRLAALAAAAAHAVDVDDHRRRGVQILVVDRLRRRRLAPRGRRRRRLRCARRCGGGRRRRAARGGRGRRGSCVCCAWMSSSRRRRLAPSASS